MKRNIAFGGVLLLVAILLGADLVARSNTPQEDHPGYAFWSKADVNLKLAYLVGYSEAESFYRAGLDGGAKPLCTDAGKTWINGFEEKFPLPKSMTMKQALDGIDEFYKDWKNQSVGLFAAQRIVRLQVAGRPQVEIDEAIRTARASSSQ